VSPLSSTRRRPHGAAWIGVGSLALAVGLAVAGSSCSPYAHLTDVRVVAPSAEDCGGCHVEIHREWSASRHAHAYDGAAFVAASSNREVALCLGCHAPRSVFDPGPPRVREARREEGVSCLACHFKDGALAGPAPRSSLLAAHPVVERAPIYTTAALCGTCHEGTYAEWRAAPDVDRPTCQACHMPEVTRTITQGTGPVSRALVRFETPYRGRRHAFHVAVEALPAPAVTLAIDRTGGQIVLIVGNGLPHRLPTGDFGSRRLAIEVAYRGAGGAERGRFRHVLDKVAGTAIAAGGALRLSLAPPPDATEVRVKVVRPAREGTGEVVLLERALGLFP